MSGSWHSGLLVSVMIFLIAIALVCSGCVSGPAGQQTPTVVLTTTSATIPPSPSPTLTPSAVTSIPSTATASLTATEQPVPTVQTSADPFVSRVAILKNYLYFPIPNCIMKDAFPEIANDPEQNREHNPKITSVPLSRINEYLHQWTDGGTWHSRPIASPRCAVEPASPLWNFVRISGSFVPRNARPSDYRITYIVKSEARELGTIVTEERLTIDKPVLFEFFIPMHEDLQDEITFVEIKFHKIES